MQCFINNIYIYADNSLIKNNSQFPDFNKFNKFVKYDKICLFIAVSNTIKQNITDFIYSKQWILTRICFKRTVMKRNPQKHVYAEINKMRRWPGRTPA